MMSLSWRVMAMQRIGPIFSAGSDQGTTEIVSKERQNTILLPRKMNLILKRFLGNQHLTWSYFADDISGVHTVEHL